MLAALLLAVLPAVAHAAPPSPVPSGIWQSRGYGHVLAIGDGAAVLYHVAGPFCYRDPDADAGQRMAGQRRTVSGRDRIAFTEGPGQTRYDFTRIARLPAACLAHRRWTPAEVARLVDATFADLYPRTPPRDRHRRRFAARLAAIPADIDTSGLYDRLAPALMALDDAHVSLATTIDGDERDIESGEAPTLVAARGDPTLGDTPAARERNWNGRYRDGIVGQLAGGGHHVANRRILWGRIGRIGYINIVAMGAFADTDDDDVAVLDAALDAALTDFRDLPGVIVDVTNNRGGYDALGLRIAGRFAARPAAAFVKQPVGVDGPGQPFRVSPAAGVRYTGPVTLLTSDITVSAAETFTLAMRALPNVRHAGGRTRGALSDQLTKPLPNGWTLTLPAETYTAPDGRRYEGTGIDPRVTVAPFAPDHARAIADIAAAMTASVEPIS